jgi:DNA-binding CsgD family transcriptional regulator/tetratricopeptide (TPR) repeat protein
LLGRQREREVLDRLLAAARGGHGAMLVTHGEPGVGKTALLDYAVEEAPDFRVVRSIGVEGEMELAFAALQQLCAPIMELAPMLPGPQQDALAVAFGISDGPAPNPFLVGLAVLGLLSEAAEQQPLLCVVDDAQWLDSASERALAFVARRLLAERIAVVFAARKLEGSLAGLPELSIEPLGHREARALLEAALPAPLDERVLDRIVLETRGNPLALLELPRGLTPAQLAGGFGLPAAMPVSTRIEESFTRRLTVLPSDARRLLLVAAADPTGDPGLVWRAAKQLGVSASAAETVESEDLVTFGASVMFRHPLVRSAVYRVSEPTERRDVHRALAEATDAQTDPDRRAWHRAQAASMPDEEVAAELERGAVRAQARGGFAAAAAFLERAAALTPEPSHRAQRALSAAQTMYRAGALDDALRLLASVEPGVLGDLERAHIALLRAEIRFVSTHGSDAPPLLLDAARRLGGLDPALARATYLEALSAAMFAGSLAPPGGHSLDVAQAAKAAPPPPGPPRGSDLLLDGLVALFTQGYEAGVPILRQAQHAFDNGIPSADQLRWKWLATVSAVHLWEDTLWETLAQAHVQLARKTGALGELPLALSQRVYVHLFAGELQEASSLVEEIEGTREATGASLTPYGEVGLAALRGGESDAVFLIERSRSDVMLRGEGVGASVLDWAEAMLYNGHGRYEEALAAALRVAEQPNNLSTSTWGMVELTEAAVRAGTPEMARGALTLIVEMATASGTEWALGVAARAQALFAEGHHAEELYEEAIDRLGKTRMRLELARARLLYGEWLRRERRRVDAREQLRVAYEMFAEFGMQAFAERARVELQGTGEHARKRAVDTIDQLTPREAQVSRLAAQGMTNREIAAQLFVSPSTVEYHLRKVFRKLDVKSRTQLARRVS